MSEPLHPNSQFYLKLDGADAPPELVSAVLEIVVENSLHLPDAATLALRDPKLHWVDHPSLEPGKTLQISAKTGTAEKLLFDGEIVEMEPAYGAGTQRLTVRAFDRLHRMARGRCVRSFLNVTDGDLVRKLAQEVGLQAVVGPANQVHDYVLQANQSNLEFLKDRASALGFLLYVQGKTLHCAPPKPNGAPIDLQWGKTLTEFYPRLTTSEQVTEVTVRGWDPVKRQEIVGHAEKGDGAPHVGEKRSGGQMTQAAFRAPAPHLVAHRPIRSQAAADQLAKAVAGRHAGRFIEAEGVCGGDPALIAGCSVKLSAVGDRFSGTYFVTAASHVYQPDHGYTTHFSISGQHPVTLHGLLAPAPHAVPANGLVIGIVTDNQDPEGCGRVKVKFPWLSAEHTSYWARVAAPGAGPDRGIEFLPEINDEVLVGFEMGDVHHPYVLGGLWNGVDAPPKKSGEAVKGGKVQKRVIRSRAGHTVTLDDSEGSASITVEDKNGNKIVLDSQKNALTIEVQGNASVKANGNLTLEAQGQVEIKGMGVKVDGGGATVDVKGSLINLN